MVTCQSANQLKTPYRLLLYYKTGGAPQQRELSQPRSKKLGEGVKHIMMPQPTPRPRLMKAANYSKENHIHNTFKKPEGDEMGTGEAEARFPNLMHRQLHVYKTPNGSEPHD